ncbi:MAG: adenylyl-sulfate kinase [Thermoplasmata archaeon]|nr:adenylyl-sulfate kinase [Thermoplasmata archaeon]
MNSVSAPAATTPAPPSVGSEGFVVWIEGLPGAGKTTLSNAVAQRLARTPGGAEVLDGQQVREAFFPELGYSRRDRETHARRVSQLARILSRHGVRVLVAMITPYETSRQAARAACGARFVEVWLSCPIDVCEKREPRGLYRQGHAGSLAHLTGLDDPFEEPLNPDLTLDTARISADAATDRVLAHLIAHHFVDAIPP